MGASRFLREALRDVLGPALRAHGYRGTSPTWRKYSAGAMRRADDGAVVHVVAAWGEWLFDFNGWNPASDLLLANEEFEQTRFNLHPIEAGIEDFCLRWNHRLPNQYHHDPTGRADAFVRRFTPPFMAAATSG